MLASLIARNISYNTSGSHRSSIYGVDFKAIWYSSNAHGSFAIL